MYTVVPVWIILPLPVTSATAGSSMSTVALVWIILPLTVTSATAGSSISSDVSVSMVLLLSATNAITANSECRSVPCLCCKGGRCSTTNKSNGTCDACRDGFTGPSCFEPCPADCVNCSQQFYNETYPYPVCYECKKGFYNGKYKDMKDKPLQEDCSLKCKENCDNCSSFSDCHLCKLGYYLDNDNQCQKCPDHCNRCNSSSDCFACENGYGWTGEFCRYCKRGCNRCKPESFDDCSDCGSGFYSDNFRCLKCVTGCRSCDGPSACNDCEDGFSLANGSCYPCQEDACTSCTLDTKSQNICISCKTGFVLYENKCEEIKCARGFFREGQCNKCPVFCTQCSSDNNCSACVNDKYGETCMQSCSPLCINNTCDHADGKCSFGCLPGYLGIKCEKSSFVLEKTVDGLTIVLVVMGILLLAIVIYLARKRCSWCLDHIKRNGRGRKFERSSSDTDEMTTFNNNDGDLRKSANRDSQNEDPGETINVNGQD